MCQIPSSLPPLFSGDRLVVYGVLKASENANEGDDSEVRLKGLLGNDVNIKHVVKFSNPPIAVENKTNVLLHQLAAKSVIQEKQDGYSERNDGQEMEEAKRSTISISKSANVVSKFTSFVAVDKDSNQPVSGPLRKHFVPSYQNGACSIPMAMQTMCLKTYSLCEARGGGAKKKGGFGFGGKSSKTEEKSRNKKFKSKGFFLSLFGGAAPPPPPAENIKNICAALPPPSDLPQAQRQKNNPPVVALVTLQKASGSWDLTGQLVSLCGSSRDALIKGCPKEIAVDKGEGKLLWATALALVLLMGKFLDQKDEWEMIAEKGSKRMKKQLPAGVKYENVLEAAATTVGVQVKLGQ